MQLRIKDATCVSEPVVELWLEDSDYGVTLKARQPGKERIFNILTISKDTGRLKLWTGIGKSLGLPVDIDRRIQLA